MADNEDKELIGKALAARSAAHCPYSKFPVGAALRTNNGKVYTGCNVENAAYPLSSCAERVAITKAVSEGDKEIVAIALATNLEDQFPSPCGGCRQIIAEFGYRFNCKIIMVKSSGETKETSIQNLLPEAFLSDALDVAKTNDN